MKYLLDTDLLFIPETETEGETDPHRAWRKWVRENESDIGFSSITLIELRLRAVELAHAGFNARASLLERWTICAEIFYRDRIVGISHEITDAARELLRHTRTTGLVPTPQDAFVAATAVIHGLRLVTSNPDTMSATMYRMAISSPTAAARCGGRRLNLGKRQ